MNDDQPHRGSDGRFVPRQCSFRTSGPADAVPTRGSDGRFLPGATHNPAGRPFGSRNRLTQDFLRDLHRSWEEHGPGALDELRAINPLQYVKLVASLIPRHFNLKVNELDELTDDQLRRRFESLAAEIARAGHGGGGGVDPAPPADPALLLPALPETG